jgi:hypothetical protein
MRKQDVKTIQSYEATVIFGFVQKHRRLRGTNPAFMCPCGREVTIAGDPAGAGHISVGVVHPIPFCSAFGANVPILAYLLSVVTTTASQHPIIVRGDHV